MARKRFRRHCRIVSLGTYWAHRSCGRRWKRPPQSAASCWI